MKIAILGAGNVGSALAQSFIRAGHAVTFGVRNPAKADPKIDGATYETGREATRDADVVILAVPPAAVAGATHECELAGKIVVDATNPITMTDGGLALTCGFETSGGEQIAGLLPASKIVKCFNSTGFGNMADPRGSMMLLCGDDPDANETVRKLTQDIGFEAYSIGALKEARLLEPLAMIWIKLAYSTDLGREFAFRIERR